MSVVNRSGTCLLPDEELASACIYVLDLTRGRALTHKTSRPLVGQWWRETTRNASRRGRQDRKTRAEDRLAETESDGDQGGRHVNEPRRRHVWAPKTLSRARRPPTKYWPNSNRMAATRFDSTYVQNCTVFYHSTHCAVN